MAAISVLSPERRIETNPFDVDAWNLLLRESQARPIDQARPFYEKLVTQFPNSGRYWKAYIEHELRGKNFENVENIFGRCLVHVLNIDLWKCYVFYVRETKGHLSTFREKMAKAYDFALERVGLDVHACTIFSDYISFLKTVPAVGQYAENQRITAVRKVFQRGISTPMVNIESLWQEYTNYEKGINPTLAEKLIAERHKEYQTARKVAKTLETVTRGINRQAVSVPPRGSTQEMKQVEMWKKYIQWEKSNPLETEEYSTLAKRVVYAYEQALLCLGYYPDIWYEAAVFLQEASKHLEQKGDIKTAHLMTSECIQLFERSINGLMKESQLLYFSYADFEEERMKFDNVKKIYEKLLEIDNVDPTLTYVQYMKFIRRTEGCVAARAIFKKGREDTRCNHHIYIASAYMEYYCNKDKNIAQRVFDLGLKKYGGSPDFAAAFVDFLCHLNEDNNTRVVFERILTSGNMPVPSQGEIWDRYLEFESLVGDLSSILKVDSRRKEICNEAETSTHMLIDRYKFLNLIPCTPEQLKLMGYNKILKGHSATTSAAVATTSAAVKNQGPQAASAVMGGTAGNMELGGFPKPDTDQMIPYKAKANTAGTYHPVPGGIFPAPPTVAHLMTMLPPPWSFRGPFVNVDALIDQINRYNPPTATSIDTKVKLENGSMLGPMRVEDVKKEFYQLLATTTDPNVAMTSGDYIHMKRKRAADSESDDENSRGATSARDIYKRRMNQKTVDL